MKTVHYIFITIFILSFHCNFSNYPYYIKSGDYELFEIVPATVNSTNDALYEIKINGVVQGSYHVNQNEGSGNWVSVGKFYLPANEEIELWISDTGNNSDPSGVVIRTDAVRFQLIDEYTDIEDEQGTLVYNYNLEQNYPNPFNPKTIISYQLSDNGPVQLSVYNSLGQKVKTLVDREQAAGKNSVTFDARNLASGVYYYKLSSGAFNRVRKMILLK